MLQINRNQGMDSKRFWTHLYPPKSEFLQKPVAELPVIKVKVYHDKVCSLDCIPVSGACGWQIHISINMELTVIWFVAPFWDYKRTQVFTQMGQTRLGTRKKKSHMTKVLCVVRGKYIAIMKGQQQQLWQHTSLYCQ